MLKKITKPIYKLLLVLLIAGLSGISAYGQDLTLRKYEMNYDVSPGDLVTYQLVYINGSANRQENVVVTDHYPENLEYVSSVPTGAIHNATARTVTFDKTVLSDFADLSSGSGVLYVTYRVGKLGSTFTGTNHYPTGYYLSSPPAIQTVTSTHTKQNVVN